MSRIIANAIPWRLKNFVSRNSPVIYYLITNFFTRTNAAATWDKTLLDWWDDPNRAWPRRATEICEITEKDDKILDVGCGTGSILRILLEHGYANLYGYEQSAVALERLGSMGINMRSGRLPKIDFDSGQFDVVIASEVLEHILFHRRFLREIVRVLKPGGQALIYVPNDCMGPISEPSHVRTYTATSLRALLNEFGEVRSVGVVREDNFKESFLFGRLVKSA